MPKIRAFIVVPYEGLGELALKLSRRYPMFDVKTAVGDLEQGVKAAIDAERAGYQMIISRGGTAEMIRKKVSIPVIGIDISGYDYMRVMTLTQNFSGKAAIVGYRSITEGAQAIKDLLKSSIDIFTIGDSQELPGLLSRLRRQDYLVIAGDAVTVKKAKEMSFNAILLTSGEESVKKAFSDALKINEYLCEYSARVGLLEQTLDKAPARCVIFDGENRPVFRNLRNENETELLSELSGYSEIVRSTGAQQALLEWNGSYWRESGHRLDVGADKPYIAYFLLECEKKKPSMEGVTVENVKNPTDFSITIFGRNSGSLRGVYEKVKKYKELSVPILITGEIGTGKDALAKVIHSMHRNRLQPFITVDGERIGGKSLEDSCGLMNSNRFSTVYWKRIDALPMAGQRMALQILSAPGFTGTHLVLASATGLPDAMMAGGTLLDGLGKLFGEYRIHLPSLRERSGEMRDLTGNYINLANARYGKQIVALDEEALKLLIDFPWTTNLDQLRRVIFQLVLTADDPYISAKEVSEALKSEIDLQPPAKTLSDKTLDEQIQDIILRTLKEENGNLTRASRRLGVSRSTIWRRMKDLPQKIL